MKSRLLGTVLVVALAACGKRSSEAPGDVSAPVSAPPSTALPAIPTDEAAGPSGVDTMTWSFDTAGRTDAGVARPRLMYHSGGSEGLAINLQCDPGANTAYALLWRGEQRANWPFSLQSGATRADLTGAASGDSEVIVRAALPIDAPVMNAFRASGNLTLIDGELHLVMNAINAQERGEIARFFTACA